jgi:transcriptional regulator with XRE-family HTH domain
MENAFGKNLKRYRLAKNLTLNSLAEKLGVKFQSVGKWEKGLSMPTGNKISLLSEILGVTPNQLLEGDEENRKLKESEEREKALQKQIDELRSELIKYQKKEIEELKEQVF